ncbi:MAG: ABC transporter ATP-binding protein [Candidatus Saccharicenans sp.]|nr:ABC transporter ATP-binding protein [Candidatus Saccharicenans sp.]
MARPGLEVRNLVVQVAGRKILEVSYFDLRKGECLALFGPNGSGKSTFLRTISLLQKPEAGEIYYQGQAVGPKDRERLQQKIVYLLQKPVFFRGTVRDNLLLGLRFRGIERKQQTARLEKTAELFNLRSLLDKFPHELSGGERQRVHLARAFILEPEFLYLDEPFNGLDVRFREELMSDFHKIRKVTGVTTVLVTHIRQEAVYLADRMAVMLEGRIVKVGTPEEISSAPDSSEISRLMGQEALVEGVVERADNGLLEIRGHGQTIYAFGRQKAGDRVVLTFRPEEVILAPARPASSVRNWFEAEVREIRPYDRMLLVLLDCGFRLKAFVSRSSVEELGLGPGSKVWAGIKATALSTWPDPKEIDSSGNEK